MNVFDIFSLHSRHALKYACVLAQKNNSEYTEPFHILSGLASEKGSIAAEILSRANLNQKMLKKLYAQSESIKNSLPEFSPASKRALERAALVSSLNEHHYIGTEHLLYGLLDIQDIGIENIFLRENLSSREIKSKIKTVFKSTSRFPQISNSFGHLPKHLEDVELDQNFLAPGKKTMLEFFSVHLTDKKIQKNIDPVIGRDAEIERIIQILCRRTKNNPVLLGDPGVGKTAIVEGLAKLILKGKVPDVLLDKKIYSLDLGLLVAGSSFRGEFEHRLKQIISEIQENDNIILFIDEIHNIIGAGSASGSLDAANILKPALSRGEIRCIGATTPEEYKKHIENDAAFERRFQPVRVEEPNPEKTLEILLGIKEHYEKFHRVRITLSAVKTAVKLSQRYLQDKFFPDKAIDLIDEAASGVRVQSKPSEKEMRIRALERQYQKFVEEKKRAVLLENYDFALDLRKKEGLVLEELSRIKKEHAGKNKEHIGEISEKDIREVVSKITKIPLQEIEAEERKDFLSLENRLSQYIIGQDAAIKTVCEYIRKSRTGLGNPDRPIGSFIFMGPSGVGKTELAKTLAREIFNDSKALIRIDMSEYAESFNISKLIGSPAGYVGYKDSNALTDQIRRKPYSVLLLDEIEKAHPLIFNLLLQILEDGELTDAAGKTAYFKNTLIIMTSNIGSDLFHQGATLGFDAKTSGKKNETQENFHIAKKEAVEKLSKFFKTEFLNRVDRVVVFSPLDISSLGKIVHLELQKLAKMLREKNIQISYNEDVVEYLAKKSYLPKIGARGVRKTISEHVENPLAEKILLTEKPVKSLSLYLEKNSMSKEIFNLQFTIFNQ